MHQPEQAPTQESAFHISNHTTTRREWGVAVGIAVLLLTGVIVVLPYGKLGLATMQPFLPLFIALVFVLDLITAFLLYSEFNASRMFPLGVLASAYLYSALITIPHILTFPGVFTDTGMLHANPQSATWLWVFWHGGFPALLLLFVWADRRCGGLPIPHAHVRRWGFLFPLLVALLVAVLAWISIEETRWLPTIIQKGNFRILITSGVGPVVLAFNLAALIAVSLRLKGRTIVGLWLSVASFAFMLDVALTLFSGARYSAGWYVARTISLISASVIMGKMLLELRHLYYRAQVMSEERARQTQQLKRLNAELRQDKQHIQSLLDSTREGMVLCGSDETVLYVNDACRRLLGETFRTGDPIASACERLWPQVAANRERLEQAIKGLRQGTEQTFNERISLQTDEEPRHFEIYGTQVDLSGDADAEGDFLLVLRDRTEEQRVDELKTEFIGVVSHELRTPLTSIRGFIEILLQREVDAEKRTKYLTTVYKEAKRLTELINDFLDLQRMESGRQEFHYTTVNLGDLTVEVAEQWRGKQKHQLIVCLPERPLQVYADADRIRQVLHNLISNAVKYSPGASQVDIILAEEAGEAVLKVRDFGLGIPEEARPRLFTKFYRVDNSDRRKIGGTGLGLSIVKDIVDAHRGRIEFESEMGCGTQFTVTLPLYETANLCGSIVLLEDDDALAEICMEALRELSHPIVRMRSAEQGIAALQSAVGVSPLLVVCDLRLEGKQTGDDFLRELYRHPAYHHTPVLVVSAYEGLLEAYEGGPDSVLKKPFTIDRFTEVALELLALNGNHPYYAVLERDMERLSAALAGVELRPVKKTGDAGYILEARKPGASA